MLYSCSCIIVEPKFMVCFCPSIFFYIFLLDMNMILAKSIGVFLTLIVATNGSMKMRKILFVGVQEVYADYNFANLLKCIRVSLFCICV